MEKVELNLSYILSAYFDVDVVTNYQSMKRFLQHPNFPNRNDGFRKELASAIIYHKITPKIYEDLTNHDLETQEEVNEFLINEIWKPLYGDEPIEGYAKSE